MNKERQIEAWRGEFGNDYIKRNELTDKRISQTVHAFEPILKTVDITSALEIGCNVGTNLAAIRRIMGSRVKLYAVEPNKTAFDALNDNADITGITEAWNCDAFSLPLDDNTMDLVFTRGVLIHIPPENLGKAVDEIYRVSGKYILCMEYFSPDPEEKSYRGRDGLLFKRDFGAYYLDRFPELECINYGFLWKRENELFDNLNWWLFRKPI